MKKQPGAGTLTAVPGTTPSLTGAVQGLNVHGSSLVCQASRTILEDYQVGRA